MGKTYKYDAEQDGDYREFKRFKREQAQFESEREEQEEFVKRSDKRSRHES